MGDVTCGFANVDWPGEKKTRAVTDLVVRGEARKTGVDFAETSRATPCAARIAVKIRPINLTVSF
jgi:hypothetical protein